MDAHKAAAILAAVVATVAETQNMTPCGGVPESMLWLPVAAACGHDLRLFHGLLDVAKSGGLLTIEGHLLRATPAGCELAAAVKLLGR